MSKYTLGFQHFFSNDGLNYVVNYNGYLLSICENADQALK